MSTAPALIIVDSMMMMAVAGIAWTDPGISIPAFLTIMAIPLTCSIANGLAFGFCSLDADPDLPRPLPRGELDGLRLDRALPGPFLLALT
jgi:hypothetical protein